MIIAFERIHSPIIHSAPTMAGEYPHPRHRSAHQCSLIAHILPQDSHKDLAGESQATESLSREG